MTITELLERARERLGTQSDRALCRELRIATGTLIAYRRGQSLPTDERMIRICDVSGVSPEAGLLMLNMWRAGGEASTTYRKMLKSWEANGGAVFNKAQDKNKAA